MKIIANENNINLIYGIEVSRETLGFSERMADKFIIK
jgi:hypothetical protein